MERPYDAYWGKADPEVASRLGVPCHLAVFHMLDVAAVAEAMLLDDAVLRSKLTWLALPDGAVAPTMAAFAALHDLGKVALPFQAKAPVVAALLRPEWTPRVLERARAEFPRFDHGSWGYWLARMAEHQRAAVATHLGGELGRDLLRATTGHHGELPRAPDGHSVLLARGSPVQPLLRADDVARNALVADLAALFVRQGAVLPLPGGALSNAAVALVAGLCSVADWVGSNVDFFPYRAEPLDLEAYLEIARGKAHRAIHELGLRRVIASGKTFMELFPDMVPRGIQTVTTALDVPEGPALFLIEAEMGMGKTEAALELVERLIASGRASGFYFALPTMATANGLFTRVEAAVPRLFTGGDIEVAGDVSLVLSHGRSRQNERFRRLVDLGKATPRQYGAEGLRGDEEARAVCARWFLSRKRTLLAPAGVGTVDQAMLAALRVHHHFVRVFGLATKVFVLDEVHAYDAFMSVILHRLLEWLGALGAPAILLSATLPGERRRALAEAYARGAAFAPSPSEPSTVEAPYPLLTCVSRSGTVLRTLDKPGPVRTVCVQAVETDDPIGVAVPLLAAAHRCGARAVWIRNTVTDAQEAWDAVVASGVPATLFHARFRGQDRGGIERDVLSCFGPEGSDGGVLIATQVVEQSLDLDFDLMVTDAAPIDLVLQRSGRLHRHRGRDAGRPEGYRDARLVVVMPAPERREQLDFGRSGFVYDATTLWLATDDLLGRATLAIPSDIRGLVERSYDPELRRARCESAPTRDALAEKAQKAEAKRTLREDHARAMCVAPARHETIALADARGDEDDDVQAMTRDGASVALLLLRWDHTTGELTSLDGDTFALDPEAPSAWQEAQRLSDQSLSVPTYRACREVLPPGEPKEWEATRDRVRRFLDSVGMQRALIVPLVRRADGTFRGRVGDKDGKMLIVTYSHKRGLAFA